MCKIGKGRYKILLLIVFLIFPQILLAQRSSFSGIIASEGKLETLDGTTVSVLREDSSVYTRTIADNSGSFKVYIDSIGSYIFKFTCVGYYPKFMNYTFKKLGEELGTFLIKMTPETVSMNEVKFRARKRGIILRKDTFIYDASSYLVPKGYTLRALIDQFPGLEVTTDGHIMFKGQKVKYFLINGQEFMYNEPQVALDHLPADYVDSVKLYRRDTEKAVQSGVGNVAKDWAMDVTIKKEYANKVLANTGAAGNTDKKYELSGFLTWLPSNLHLTVYGDRNNTSQDPEFSNDYLSTYSQPGRRTTTKAGANISWVNGIADGQAGQLKIQGQIDFKQSKGSLESRDNTLTFYDDNFSVNNWHKGNDWFKRTEKKIRSDIRWKANKKLYLSSEVQLYHLQRRQDFTGERFQQNLKEAGSTAVSVYEMLWQDTIPHDVVNTKNSWGYNQERQTKLTWDGYMSNKLNEKGRSLSLDSHYEVVYPYTRTNNYNMLIGYYNNSIMSKQEEERQLDKNKHYTDWELKEKLSYTDNLWHNTYLTLSYSFNTGDRRGTDLYMLNDTVSQYHSYNNHYVTRIHNIGTEIKQLMKKTSLSLKINLQGDFSKYYYQRAVIDTLVKNHHVSFNPSITATTKTGKADNWKFKYNMEQHWPSLYSKVSYYNDLDPLRINIQNTRLKTENKHSFLLSYDTFVSKQEANISTSVSADIYQNAYRRYTLYDKSTGVSTYMTQNVNGIFNVKWEGFLSAPLSKTVNVNYQINADASWTHDKNFFTIKGSAGQENTWNNWAFSVYQSLKYSDRKRINTSLKAIITYNGNFNEQSPENNFHQWDFNLSGDVLYKFPWGMEFHTDMNYEKRYNSYFSSINRPECIWNIELSQSLLKNKNLQCRFEWKDILHSAKSYNVDIDQNHYYVSWQYLYTSYIMLHLTYQFNL